MAIPTGFGGVIQGRFLTTGPRLPACRNGVVQLRESGNAQALPSGMIRPNGGGGRPLPDGVRQKMESYFKADFSDVRVHIGSEAPAIGALAFTHGSNLYFAPGQYNPDSPHGQQLLGHELTHVLQQRAGRVRNPFGSGIAVVQDPALEREADNKGAQAAAHRPPGILQTKAAFEPQPHPSASVQPSPRAAQGLSGGGAAGMLEGRGAVQRRGSVMVSFAPHRMVGSLAARAGFVQPKMTVMVTPNLSKFDESKLVISNVVIAGRPSAPPDSNVQGVKKKGDEKGHRIGFDLVKSKYERVYKEKTVAVAADEIALEYAGIGSVKVIPKTMAGIAEGIEGLIEHFDRNENEYFWQNAAQNGSAGTEYKSLKNPYYKSHFLKKAISKDYKWQTHRAKKRKLFDLAVFVEDLPKARLKVMREKAKKSFREAFDTDDEYLD